MSDQYYLRVRGRVLGPYDCAKLQGLAKRGQFSRMHEVSTDSVSWTRAGSFPELFANTSNAAVSEVSNEVPLEGDDTRSNSTSQFSGSPGGFVLGANVPPDSHKRAAAASGWHFTQGGAQHGPVEFSALQVMVNSGRLSPTDQVWTEGMSEWQAPTRVPGLILQQPAPATQASTANVMAPRSDEVSTEACRALVGARPWILFIAIVLTIYAGLCAIGGVFSLIAAGQKPLGSVVFLSQGLFALVWAIIQIAAAYLLLSYAGHIKELQFTHSMLKLEAALNTVRIFWVFCGIVLLVVLALLLVLAIWVVAVAGSLSAFQ